MRHLLPFNLSYYAYCHQFSAYIIYWLLLRLLLFLTADKCLHHLLPIILFPSFITLRLLQSSFTATLFISFPLLRWAFTNIIYCQSIDCFLHFTASQLTVPSTLLPVNWLFPPLYCQSIDCFLHFTASQLTVSSTLLPVNWLFPPLYCQSIDCFLHFTASQLTVPSTLLPVNWLLPSLYCQSIDCFLHFTASQLTVSFTLLPVNWLFPPFYCQILLSAPFGSTYPTLPGQREVTILAMAPLLPFSGMPSIVMISSPRPSIALAGNGRCCAPSQYFTRTPDWIEATN